MEGEFYMKQIKKEIRPTIEELTQRIYNVCLFKEGSDRPKIKGDMTTFDLMSLEAFRNYVIVILDSIRCIPQFRSAVNSPIVEMGLALGELKCETMPSSWYSDVPYGVPSMIERVYPEINVQPNVASKG